jgi:endonuclease/exonuclease/phosphatase family metal-dependent hydrolase
MKPDRKGEGAAQERSPRPSHSPARANPSRRRLRFAALALSGAALIAALLGAAFVPALGATPSPQGARPASLSAEVTFLAWNVENLFDAKDDGTEYAEFSVKKGKWDEGKYRAKLEATAQVIKAAGSGREGKEGPDLVCLEEIENPQVLERLAKDYLGASGYRYLAMAPAKRSSVNCGLLSRFPITRQNGHKAAGKGHDQLRYILEVELSVEGRPLVVFVNHWKSKVGGGKSTEALRVDASFVLAERVRELVAQRPGLDIVACGDFNENADEFAQAKGAYQTAFVRVADSLSPDRMRQLARRSIFLCAPSELGGSPLAAARGAGALVLGDPWLEAQSAGRGSYYSSGKWETIDHFLLTPSLMDGKALGYSRFAVEAPAFMLSKKGRPKAFDPKKGSGYSDHMPILLSLSLK